jgi:hypothetical protein
MTVVSWVIFSFWKGSKKYIMATALLANPGFQDLCFHLSLVDDEFIMHQESCCGVLRTSRANSGGTWIKGW